MEDNPIAQFFPDDPEVNLYDVLSVVSTATASEIKSAYRRQALLHHPDKHASLSPEAQRAASTRFQQVGFAYAVLGDETRRKKYDETGSTQEGIDWAEKGSDQWETYFEQMFEKVTRAKLDEMKKEYQGSEEELTDLTAAYLETGGSMDGIMSYIPHSNYTDEPRFVKLVNGLISKGELEVLPAWTRSLKDATKRSARKRKGMKEAQEAESMAKGLGVWDEFYGTGKEGKRTGKGKGRNSADGEGNAGNEESLKAIIQGRQTKLNGFFDDLAAKYGAAEVSNGKKRAIEPDIDEEEFARIQQKFKKSSRSKRVKH